MTSTTRTGRHLQKEAERVLADSHRGFHELVYALARPIVILRENSLSYAEIARQVGGSVTLSGVRKLCLRYEETKSVINKAKSGRKKCTSASDDRKLKRIFLKDRRVHQMLLDVK